MEQIKLNEQIGECKKQNSVCFVCLIPEQIVKTFKLYSVYYGIILVIMISLSFDFKVARSYLV